MVPFCSQRALGRALLARQLLLRRAPLSVTDAVEHLVGMQAQASMPPYYGLWARLERFDPQVLGRTLLDRETVRLTLMRGTVHLVTARDANLLRPITQVAIERGHNATFGRRMVGVDPARLAAAVRGLLRDGPLSARELGRRLVEEGIADDAEAAGFAAVARVPLVQVPPRGVWGSGGQARYLTLEQWTGTVLEPRPSIDAVVLRYLAAFGPASVMDVQNWSGLTRLKRVLTRLRPQLVTFTDDRGRELFDLPDAPRPDPETPAPPRFLGQFDNVLLGHADRRRIIADDAAGITQGISARRWINHVLVDGMLRASWWAENDRKQQALMTIRLFKPFSAPERQAVGEEAERLLELAAGDAASRDVRFETG
jgi:Winged helix DNA-binding domain